MYKRQITACVFVSMLYNTIYRLPGYTRWLGDGPDYARVYACLLYTSDAADERSSVDLGGRRIIKKKKKLKNVGTRHSENKNNNTDSQRH